MGTVGMVQGENSGAPGTGKNTDTWLMIAFSVLPVNGVCLASRFLRLGSPFLPPWCAWMRITAALRKSRLSSGLRRAL